MQTIFILQYILCEFPNVLSKFPIFPLFKISVLKIILIVVNIFNEF